MAPTTTTAPTSRPTRPAAAPPLRTPALVAGIGTLLLAVLSAWANFGVVEALITEGDAARTARGILGSQTTFQLGIACLAAAAVLDVVVAWALRAFLAPAHRGLSTAAASLRIIYAGFFAVAIAQLAAALDVLQRISPSVANPGQLQAEALRHIESFHSIWDVGLAIFGLHLALVGYLAVRSGYVPRLLGWLVAVAGAGYVLDSAVALLAPGSLPEVAVVTFVGEVWLLIWLLARGTNATPPFHHAHHEKEIPMTTTHPTVRSKTHDPSSRKAAVTAGLLFFTATLTFLIGDGLIADHFTAPTGTVGSTTLTIGVALQAMCALAVVGIAVALLEVLGRHSKKLARGHLAVRVLEAIAIIAIGTYILTTGKLVAHYEILIYGFTGTAGLMLSYVLHTARLVPRWLTWMGLIGYVAILMAIPSTLLDVATLDSGPGMLLYVPGGLFEFILPILLISRGFRRGAETVPSARARALAEV